jgi:hypothetical protein
MKGQISGLQGDADKDPLNTTIDDNEERELCSLCWASKEGFFLGYAKKESLNVHTTRF